MPAKRGFVLLAGLAVLLIYPAGFAAQNAKKPVPAATQKSRGQASEEVLTNDSVIELLKAGIGEDVIISKILRSRHNFDLSVQGLVALKEGRASNRLIRFLMDSSKGLESKATPSPVSKQAPVTPPAPEQLLKRPETGRTESPASDVARFTISGFVGNSSTSVAPRQSVVLYSKDSGREVDIVQTNFLGKYTFKDVMPGIYSIKVGKISRDVAVVKKNLRVDINLGSEDGAMDYGKSTAPSNPPSPSGKSQAAGPSDASLMQAMAAEYYSYSGSTERKVMLCADGRYYNASESSYSGTSSDSLGNQTLAWGSAGQRRGEGRWTVQGTQQRGTITFIGNDGTSSQVQYQTTGERGCFTFNGTTACVSGPPRCQ